MSEYVKSSLLDDFEIPIITHEAIKQQLIKIGKTHNVKKKESIEKLPLEERLKLIQKEVYKVLGRYKGFVKVIYTKEELDAYIDKAIKVDYLAFDTETNNSLDPLTCKVMGLCLYIPNTKPVYVPLNHCVAGTDILLENQVSEEDATIALKRLKEKDTKVVYHNGKFDIRVIYNTLGFYMPIWWDTMLAAQMINENERAGLKVQYKKYINPTIDSYNIEKLFAGIPYAWVDPEVFALYAAIDAFDTYQLQQYQEEFFNQPENRRMFYVFHEIEVPITSVVAKMEDDGIDIDMEFVGKLNQKYHKGLDTSIENINEILKPYEDVISRYQEQKQLDNPLNFNSTPQLQIILYDILKIPPSEEFGKSTEKAALKAMKHPFTEALLEYRHFNKMITAFTESLPKLRSPKDGKIHASFNQMGKEENNVRTGRFSSTDPNLQQIPSKEKIMRLMFKASPGYVIVGGDYSQQEPRLLTHMCRDPKLIDTYNNKKDLYATIAASVFKKDYWECMEHWEDGTPNPTGKGIRSKAKSLVLGIMYGMGAKLMASMLDTTIDECLNILDEFYNMFPTVREFTQQNEQMAKEKGFVEDYLGRQRHLPHAQLKELRIKGTKKVLIENDVFLEDLKDSYLTIEDEELTRIWNEKYDQMKNKSYNNKVKFKEQAKLNDIDVFDNGAFISKSMTQCTNARIQGSAATLTKKAMIDIFRSKELNDLGFRILVPVHDELLGECPKENSDKVEELLVKIMVDAAKPDCSVNMKVDTYCVKHWYSDEVANSIRETFLDYCNGNEKKKIVAISKEEAYEKMIHKYEELSRQTVIDMCNDEFDHVNGKL